MAKATKTTRARTAKGRSRKPVKRAPAPPRLRAAIDGLEQRHLDLIGLAMVALGVYCSFVLYLGWDGGRVGEWLASALEHAVGQVAYVLPLAVCGLGLAAIARPMIKAPRALNVGVVLVVGALLLAFAAGTLGMGPDQPVRDGYFEPRYFTEHGGAIGEAMYWASSTLFQDLGAHILAVLLCLSGFLLLTGMTIANMVESAGGAARRARRGTREMASAVRSANGFEPDVWGEPTDADIPDIRVTRANETEPFATEPIWVDTEPAEDEPAVTAPPVPSEEFSYEPDPAEPKVQPGEVLAAEASDEEPAEAEGVRKTPMGTARTPGGITVSDEVAYAAPPPTLLKRGKGDPGPDPADVKATAKALLDALRHFGVEARMVGTVSGPHVSRYDFQLAPGTKVGKVAQLKDDLAYALAATDIRILAPIPGKKAVGVEVPNSRRRVVRLGDIYDGRPAGSSPLLSWLGKDVAGNSVYADIALMPHLLVAGTTGSGKSACINAMLSSILLHASPNEVRMVLVDPKRVELNHYESLPHLMTPVVTNPRLAATVLGNLIGEMESRYGVMEQARTRSLAELNKARKKTGEAPLPHILCVIDELADLMMVAPAEVEDSIIRLAQKSRAVGIHLVLATQRPSTDVITGTIKVNIPSRIAFAVASQVDSRVILDAGGAETLLGQGDMLFNPVGSGRMNRIQGAFVGEDEIARISRHWAKQGEPDFDPELLEDRTAEASELDDGEFSPDEDALLDDAARIVVESGTASVSMIQRRLRVGYTRAGRLIDMLERRGIISGYEGSKPRQVLVSHADLARVLGGGSGGPPQPPESRSSERAGADTETELEPV